MRRRNFLSAGAAVGGLGLLAACAPGSDSGGGGETAPAADEVETDIASLGDITLTVWDQEVRGAQNDAIEALLGAFQEKFPNVTVERNSRSFDDLQQQTSLALSGNDVPDVLQVNNARGDMGTFVANSAPHRPHRLRRGLRVEGPLQPQRSEQDAVQRRRRHLRRGLPVRTRPDRRGLRHLLLPEEARRAGPDGPGHLG